MAFIETSAYDKTGIDDAFTIVLKRICLSYESFVEIYELNSSNQLDSAGISNSLPIEKKTIKINLSSNYEEEKKKKKCC